MIAGIPTTHSVGVSSEAQVCQLCCSCVCQSHRILCGNPGLDEEGKALGWASCQRRDAVVCRENQKRVMTFLGVPDDIELVLPKVKGGKRKGEGKGKDEAGKGKSKRWSSSSSSSVGRPQ